MMPCCSPVASAQPQLYPSQSIPGKHVLAYHGTAQANLASIRGQGLAIGGAGVPVRHGTAYGVGIYTSKTPCTALNYAPDGKVIACAVCIPDTGFGGGVHEFGNIMVIKHPALVLPMYLIHFHRGSPHSSAPATFNPQSLALPPPLYPTARQLRRQQYLKEHAKRSQRFT